MKGGAAHEIRLSLAGHCGAVIAILPPQLTPAPPASWLIRRPPGTYLKMTLMMSALPLGLLGGIRYWLWHRYSPRRKPSAAPSHPVQISAADGVLERRGA